MGCGPSKTKEHSGREGKDLKTSGSRKRSGQGETLREEVPDPGLYSTHRAIKSLGKGGTGETWLYQDRVTGEEVAIKLMRRPLPKVIEPNIQREIRVLPRLVSGFSSWFVQDPRCKGYAHVFLNFPPRFFLFYCGCS